MANGGVYAGYNPNSLDEIQRKDTQKRADAQRFQQATVGGQAQGNAATAFIKSLQSTGLPILGSSNTNSAGGPGGASAGAAGGGSIPPQVQSPSMAGLSSAATVAPVDTSAAQSAIFARAKDQVGQSASGALAGLRSAAGASGMLGGQAQFRGMNSVANKGLGELGETSRTQAITSAGQAQENANTNYAGGITQRGQDIGLKESGYLGQIHQRGQDIQAQQAQAQLQWQQTQFHAQQQQQVMQGLLSALGGGGRSY